MARHVNASRVTFNKRTVALLQSEICQDLCERPTPNKKCDVLSEAEASDLSKVSEKDHTMRRFTHKVGADNLFILKYWWEHVLMVRTQTCALGLFRK